MQYYNPVRFFGYGTRSVNVNKRLRLVREDVNKAISRLLCRVSFVGDKGQIIRETNVVFTKGKCIKRSKIMVQRFSFKKYLYLSFLKLYIQIFQETLIKIGVVEIVYLAARCHYLPFCLQALYKCLTHYASLFRPVYLSKRASILFYLWCTLKCIMMRTKETCSNLFRRQSS